MPYFPWPEQKYLSFSQGGKSKVDWSLITSQRQWQQIPPPPFSERSILHEKISGDWRPLKGKRVPLIWTLVYLIEIAVRYIQLLFLLFSDSETGPIEISLRKRKKGQRVSIKQLYCVMWQKRKVGELSWKPVVNVLNIILLSLSAGRSNFMLMTIPLSRHSA